MHNFLLKTSQAGRHFIHASSPLCLARWLHRTHTYSRCLCNASCPEDLLRLLLPQVLLRGQRGRRGWSASDARRDPRASYNSGTPWIPKMENQMEKKIENDMETGLYRGPRETLVDSGLTFVNCGGTAYQKLAG